MPNTREKLIELLYKAEEQADKRCDFAENCEQCPANNRENNCLDWLKADCLIANGVTIQEDCHWATEQAYKNGYEKGRQDAVKWIPVTERLPEENTAVLTYRESGIQAEFRWHKGWDNDEFTPCQVTHWMPLPEPPKGE